MRTEPLPHRAASLIVGMTAERVEALLGPPLRQEKMSRHSHWLRWHYPEGFAVELRDDGDGLKVIQWIWHPKHCPKCGKKLGEGATRCWTKGCDYFVPASIGTVPFVELPDGRVVMAHWIERPQTPTSHGRHKEWTLTLEEKAFRMFDRKQGQWQETFRYGQTRPFVAPCSPAPDGRLLTRYTKIVDAYYDTIALEVELLFDIEKMEVEYRTLFDPEDSWNRYA